MGSRQIQVIGILTISVPAGVVPPLEEMLRVAAEHRAVLEVPAMMLVFPDDDEMQRRWNEYVAATGLSLELNFDPILGELGSQDRQAIAEFVSVHSGNTYLDVRRADSQLQRVVRAITSQHAQQTSVALRKLIFIREPYKERLWHSEWGLNLSRLYELLTEPDNSLMLAAIRHISYMSELRAQYLRDFVIACRQRGLVTGTRGNLTRRLEDGHLLFIHFDDGQALKEFLEDLGIEDAPLVVEGLTRMKADGSLSGFQLWTEGGAFDLTAFVELAESDRAGSFWGTCRDIRNVGPKKIKLLKGLIVRIRELRLV